MTLKSTKALIQQSLPDGLDFWRSKLLWASRVLPMPLVGLFVITGLCWPVKNQDGYPELEALSKLDLGAALKIFLAKQPKIWSLKILFIFFQNGLALI